MTGGWESVTEYVAVVSAALPHASLAVKVTRAVSVQAPLKPKKLLVQVTLEHSSVARAPPKLLNQASTPDVLHSDWASAAGVLMEGGVLSTMEKEPVTGVVLPQTSEAVKTTVTESKQSPLVKPKVEGPLLVQVMLVQESVAVAPPREDLQEE
jgi:hypothetical protein